MVAAIRGRWDHRQIADLFDCPNCDARKVAALAYGLVGGECSLKRLAPLLHDADATTAQMAEHAMWSVWFRLGTPDANHEVCRGSQALNRGDYDHAISHFTRAIAIDPSFAEAYNQRGLTKFLQEDYDACVEDCRRAVRADAAALRRARRPRPLSRPRGPARARPAVLREGAGHQPPAWRTSAKRSSNSATASARSTSATRPPDRSTP